MDLDRAQDPWGLAEPPAPYDEQPLPPRLAELAGLIAPRAVPDDFAWPSVEELPEVAELMALGWQVVDANDIGLCLLPAVWPVNHRCWLPDRLPKVFTSFDGTSTRVLPMSMRRHEPYDWEAEYAEAAGLPSPPPHRVWLLRSPWPWLGQRVVLSLLRGRALQLHGPEASPPELASVAAEMLSWTPEQLLSWWVGPDADAAAAWQAIGREGDEVADLVVRGLGPTELVRLPDLDERQAIAWGEATGLSGEELVSAIAAWRARGLPADPPSGLWLLREWTDERIDAWLAEGFDVEELYGVVEPYGGVSIPLEQAITWRAAGVPLAEAASLLSADPVLTPAEAAAFTTVGIDEELRLSWLRYGFGATEAAAWTVAGISVQRARIWRSLGHTPADVGPGEIFPPGWNVGAWVGRHPKDDPDMVHPVQDPPGTRGRPPQR